MPARSLASTHLIWGQSALRESGAESNMQAHFELTTERVRNVVPENAVGFYRLGNVVDGQFWPEYFGRSDRNLQSRLIDHARDYEGVSQFSPVVTENIQRAYQLECREWHLQGEEMENEIHPARPRLIAYQCPYCQMEQNFAEIQH